MAIKLHFDDIMIFFTALSPIFISTYLVLDSFFQYNARSFFYLAFLLITQIVAALFRPLIGRVRPWIKSKGKPGKEATHDFCEVFEDPFGKIGNSGIYTAPGPHAVFHAFTFIYLLLGNINNPNRPGTPFICFAFIYGLLDLVFRWKSDCSAPIDILWGLVIGGLSAWGLWSLFFHTSKFGKRNVYYAQESNAKKCKLNKKQQFRCEKKLIK
jgi:hypothetical protein